MFKIQNTYNEYESKTVRMPKYMAEQLAQIALDNNISLNELVNQCIKYAIDNLEKPESKN
ncbi:MAG: hypothetical protein NC485_05815 [Ruminococcus flavefaciens]|nr:hypothetical protein [Ruminococcus flavefaciens]MCM1059143.1 hypothetical protein [Eubacterium sp.]